MPAKIQWFSSRDVRSADAGGVERATFEIARRLARRGWDVSWTSGSSRSLPPCEVIDGVTIHRYPGWIVPRVVCALWFRSGSRGAIVIDDLGHVVPWPSPLLSMRPGIAVFHHLHARTLSGQVSGPASVFLSGVERLYPLLYRDWQFVVPSRSSARDLQSLGVPASRVLSVPLGVDTDLFRLRDKSPSPQAVYFGGMRRYKRPTVAVRAIAAMRDAGIPVTLVMAGVGPEVEQCERLARRLGVSQQVRFEGRLSDERLAELVGSSWVHIHCSSAEGFGLAALEASAAGTPTVAFNVAGISEVVVPGRNGLLAGDGDIVDIARKCQTVLADYRRWIEPCRQFAQAFSWESTVDVWERSLLPRALDEDTSSNLSPGAAG